MNCPKACQICPQYVKFATTVTYLRRGLDKKNLLFFVSYRTNTYAVNGEALKLKYKEYCTSSKNEKKRRGNATYFPPPPPYPVHTIFACGTYFSTLLCKT